MWCRFVRIVVTFSVATSLNVFARPPAVNADEEAFSSADVSVADANVAPAGLPQLIGVSVGAHDGFDRVVFRFSSHVPGYDVGYVDRLRADGSDAPISISGAAIIHVAFHSVASAQVGAPAAPQGRQKPNFDELREVVGAGDFEGVVSFGLGVSIRSGFRVTTLTEPDRIVVDVQHQTLVATGSAPSGMVELALIILAVGFALVLWARRTPVALKIRSSRGRPQS